MGGDFSHSRNVKSLICDFLWPVEFSGLEMCYNNKDVKCVCSLAQSLSLFSSAYKNDHAPRAFFFTLDQDGKYI